MGACPERAGKLPSPGSTGVGVGGVRVERGMTGYLTQPSLDSFPTGLF
jgi:hypothetical protein